MRTIICAASVLFLVSCGGDGGGGGIASTCQFVGGASACNGAQCNSSTNVSDRNLGTFGRVNGTTDAFLSTSNGTDFSAGGNVGAFVTRPVGATAADITLATTLNGDLNVVESATGAALTVTPTANDPATEYVSFTNSLPFDGVRLVINSAAPQEYLVFEFCGTAVVE